MTSCWKIYRCDCRFASTTAFHLGGISIANPVPAQDEIPADEMAGVIAQALADCAAHEITGKGHHAILARSDSVEITARRVAAVQCRPVRNNARLGAALAVAYVARRRD